MGARTKFTQMLYAVTGARLVYSIIREAGVAIAEEDYFETETTVLNKKTKVFSI